MKIRALRAHIGVIWCIASWVLILGCDDGGGGDRLDATITDAAADTGRCAPGRLDCPCLMDDTCRLPELTCQAGICRDLREPCDPTVDRCRPSDPQCWTPCRGDVIDPDGSVRVCAADGLVRGCLPGALCMQGSCSAIINGNAQVAEPGRCETSAQCPEFQVCLEGRCYAECEQNAECDGLPGNPRACVLRVCREQCDPDQPCTDAETFCDDGVCQVVVAPDDPVDGNPGAFSVETDALQFTRSFDASTISVQNTGSGALTVTVRKAEQVSIAADGTPERITAQPMPWLTLDGERRDTLDVQIEAGETVEVAIGAAADHDLSRYTGRLELSGPGLAVQEVSIGFSTGVTGRWSGTAFVFGSFEGGDEIDAWMADRTNAEPAIPNAFMQVWARYRNDGVPQDEMGAIVQATLTGAWDQPRVRSLCRAAGFEDGALCAPFNDADGVIPYVANPSDNPVPAGVVRTPFSIEVQDGDCEGRFCGVGRIDSQVTLHNPGDPEIVLTFNEDPAGCARDSATQGCVTPIDGLDAEMIIGARTLGPCESPSDAYDSISQPWLVEGFAALGGGASTTECRATGGPFSQADGGARNARFAEANPVPDGKPRRRSLSLIDGLIIEQNLMVLLVRETVEPLDADGAPLVSYQYIVLNREQADPADLDTNGNTPTPVADAQTPQGPSCDPAMLASLTGGVAIDALDANEQARLARILIIGGDRAFEPLPDEYTVHSLCTWDEQVGSPEPVEGVHLTADDAQQVAPGMVRRSIIDAGPDGDRPCFPGAEVIFFAIPGQPGRPANWPCNRIPHAEVCLLTVQNALGGPGTRAYAEARAASRFQSVGSDSALTLVARCDVDLASCNSDRFDLTRNKSFGLIDGASTFFSPLDEAVAGAFNYKTRFVSRSGTSLGFSPAVCRNGVRPNPYCFDIAAIAEVKQRVDCLLALHEVADDRGPIIAGLQRVFGAMGVDPDEPILSRGFEDLYAELLIMRGDDALTAAYALRYAVGGGVTEPFEGADFEQDGLNLSGIAGAEMAQLHRAVQTYDIALNRFFRLAPTLWRNAGEDRPNRFITEDTVTGWMERVIRASTQRARAMSEIARRYQIFSRPDLAADVLQRAYVRAHQEGLVLTSLINAIADQVGDEFKPAVRRSLAQAQRRYRVALLEMADVHERVISGTDYFGLPQGFVPFPALDESPVNGFEEMLARSTDRLALAAQDEERAIARRREFDNDEAAFRTELVTQRNSYEAALGEICGTFVGLDGRTYPAIRRYADQVPEEFQIEGELAFDGDPCGRWNNGALWLKAVDLRAAQVGLTRVRQEASNALSAMRDVFIEVEGRCGLIAGDAIRFLTDQGVIDGIEGGIDGMNLAVDIIDKLYSFISASTNRAVSMSEAATPAAIATHSMSNGLWVAAASAHFVSTTVLEGAIVSSRAEIRRKSREYEAYTIGRECDYLRHERAYRIREMERDFLLTKLDVLQAAWDIDVEISLLRSLLNERNRLEAEWDDAELLATEAASAQSDPTKRIYKNNAIRNAEKSFEVALRAAWQATLTYEYYVGATYPQREALFLARLVDRGDVTLRRYVEDLREAFFGFEQSFGNPDTRVARISMCDDVIGVPRLGPDGEILTELQRTTQCRAFLNDPKNLDANGALRIPFSTDFDPLSPRTINHKILFAEVGIHGDVGGDSIARVYLESTGTGVVSGTDGERRFYTFPPRTAVMNPFFTSDDSVVFGQNGNSSLAGPTRSIYRSYRFRERPFVQSAWALVLDQRSEQVNRDINLGGINDIVVDFYYTDFTGDSE